MHRAACRALRRYSSPLPTTAAASATATSAPLPCIRVAASPAAARSPFWKKRKRSRKCPTSRAISMTSAARRQTSGCPPAKSKRNPACASGKSVLLRTLQGVAGGSQRVSPHSPEAAETPQGEAGVYPFRYPVRLCHGGQGRHLLQGTGGRARQRAAESGSGACEQRGAGQNGQAPYRVLRSVPEAVL